MTQRPDDALAWWAALTHGGMLIAPARIAQYFRTPPEPLPAYLADRLRRDLLRATGRDASHLSALLDTVLEDILGLKASLWTRGSEVDARWSHRAMTGEVVKPRRVWHSLVDSSMGPGSASSEFVLPVFIADVSPASRSGSTRRR